MQPIEELKKIKVNINRYNIPKNTDSSDELLDFTFSNTEKLHVHLNPSEGTKPLFDEKKANITPIPDRSNSRNSHRQYSPQSRENQWYEERSSNIKNSMNKLEHMLEEMKRTTLHEDRRNVKSTHRKRQRSSIRSPSERSRLETRSPSAKRIRSDSKYSNRKYGPRNYRYSSISSHSSRSSGSDLSREQEADMSTFLTNDSRSNFKTSRSRNYRNDSYKTNTKYDSKSSRKYEYKDERYDSDYYRHATYNDLKERYARYYTVMYAFNIIMDILRRDDLNKDHF